MARSLAGTGVRRPPSAMMRRPPSAMMKSTCPGNNHKRDEKRGARKKVSLLRHFVLIGVLVLFVFLFFLFCICFLGGKVGQLCRNHTLPHKYGDRHVNDRWIGPSLCKEAGIECSREESYVKKKKKSDFYNLIWRVCLGLLVSL